MGSFVGASSNGGNVAALTSTNGVPVTWPAGVQAGDIAILPWTFVNTATPTDPTSETFTLVNDGSDGSARMRLLHRICNGTESGSIGGWSNGATTNRQTAVLFVVRGYQFISGFSVRLESVTGTSHDNPAITTLDGYAGNTPADGDTIVIITSTRDGATTVVTAPAGYAKRTGSEVAATGSGGTHTAVADDGLTDSVTLPHDPAAWTGYGASSGNAVTITLALRPASTSTPKAGSDAAALSDSVTSLQRSSAVTDSAAMADAAALAATASGSDAFAVTDAVTALQRQSAVSDAAVMSEAAAVVQQTAQAGTDGALLGEQAAVRRDSTVTDSATLTEAASAAATAAGSDSATLAESAVVLVQVSATDVATMADAAASSQLTTLAGSDSASLTEAAAVTTLTGLVGADTAALAEAAQVQRQAALADSATLQEAASVAVLVGASDQAELSEIVGVAVAVTASDVATLNESASPVSPAAVTPRPDTGTTTLPVNRTPRPDAGTTERH